MYYTCQRWEMLMRKSSWSENLKKNPSCGFCNIAFSYSLTGSKASKAAIPGCSQSKPNFTRKLFGLCYFWEWQLNGEEIHTHPCETISSVKIISKLEKIYWTSCFFLHSALLLMGFLILNIMVILVLSELMVNPVVHMRKKWVIKHLQRKHW